MAVPSRFTAPPLVLAAGVPPPLMAAAMRAASISSSESESDESLESLSTVCAAESKARSHHLSSQFQRATLPT